MKNIYSLILLFTIMVSGCSQDEEVKEQPSPSEPLIFTASFEDKNSRTYLNEDEHLCWTANDLISIFAANTYNQKYEFQGKTGANSGDFEAVTSNSYQTGNDLSRHYAIYPYNSSSTITENGVITATLPAEQSYAVKSFGLGANTMVAATADKNDKFLKFKNVGGYLELNLYGNDVTVKSITLQGNSNEKIAGSATITPIYNGNPTVEMANNATNTITLDCGEGVKISSTAETATAFWMVIPPTTFEEGFTITITDVNDNEFTKSTSKNIEIERNVIQSMSAFEVETQSEEIPYLTFSANAEQSLTMSKAIATLEYSVDGSEWLELGTNTVDFGGELGDLRIRGKSSWGTATKNYVYSNFVFGTNASVSCIGDIRTLIDYENYEKTNTANARFGGLFANCTCLIKAPRLPITTLASSCYIEMFSGCKLLTEAPELPATTLNLECYYKMFLGCSSLTEAPQLPAETLANSCYGKMFYYCTQLMIAPELPAKTLTEFCYASMFYNCESLTTVPVLAATTLADGCCMSMFKECKNLTIVPNLFAPKLVDSCYAEMFAYCSKLDNIKMLATDISGKNCLAGWVLGVADKGTFTKNKSMNSLQAGTSGIPSGWTIKNYDEE